MSKSLSAVMLSISILMSATGTFATTVDSDRDGMSDELEAALLKQFEPRFLISAQDCSVRPAEFVPLNSKPIIQAENGTIYGQATPRKRHPEQVELHYYHLWRIDCGDMGHNLDAEHVSALVSRDEAANWKALYWYSAAHEDTVCDASQIARASTVDAELHGPKIWISRGKHASFLSDLLCARGCGGDECRDLQPLAVEAIINLGEPSVPVGGATWAADPQWPLADKMRRSDFADARIARFDQFSATTVLWANPQKRPYQAAIHGGHSTVAGVATGARATDAALDLADVKTGNALTNASNSTGNGLAKSYSGVKKALSVTVQKVGKALGSH